MTTRTIYNLYEIATCSDGENCVDGDNCVFKDKTERQVAIKKTQLIKMLSDSIKSTKTYAMYKSESGQETEIDMSDKTKFVHRENSKCPHNFVEISYPKLNSYDNFTGFKTIVTF